jgi:hypothetical protein
MRPTAINALLTLATPLLLAAQPARRWIIGGENDAVTSIGRIDGVAAMPRRFVVLEADAPFLKVFDYAGKLVQTLGRAGGGPGEFRSPSGMAYDAARRRLLVVDPSNARVTVYQVGDTLAAPRLLTLPEIGIRSVCTLGGRLFALARNAPTILRELREDNGKLTVIASFGEPRTNHPLGTHPLVRTRASDGPLLCDEPRQRIIAASAPLGEVHVFDAQTRQQVTAPIPGFQRITMTVDANSMTMSVPPDGFDTVRGLVLWDGAVQAVSERARRVPNDAPESVGFALAAIGARGPGALGPRIRWRPLASTPNGSLCAQSEPAPTIALFPAGRCP